MFYSQEYIIRYIVVYIHLGYKSCIFQISRQVNEQDLDIYNLNNNLQ